MKRLNLIGFVVALFATLQLTAAPSTTKPDISILPMGAEMSPEALPHFPDPLHAFVFRNWNIVPVERLASIVGATDEQILSLASSMGLPSYKAPAWKAEEIYITLIKHNWHLLPYEQLLELVEMTPERLNSVLREDDFLWVKLGHKKPLCEPIRYTEPTAEKREQAKKIASSLSHFFAETPDAKPLFSFVEEIQQVDKHAKSKAARKKGGEEESLRIIYSYFTLYGDPLLGEKEVFPEGLLEKLSKTGVNGVWLHVLLRDLAPGGEKFPEFGKDCEKRLATLKKAAETAGKYGIKVYLYLNEPRAMHKSFFQNSEVEGRLATRGVREGDYHALCTSNEDVRNWMRDALTHIFTRVPELGGVFTISGSENLTFCNSHGGSRNCPVCKERDGAEVIADANALIAEGVHRASPDAKVLIWDWGWNRHGIATDIITKLPKDVWVMSVSEWAIPFERGGVKGKVGEYSMSVVGPGPRAKTHWATAKEQGLKSAAKIQLNCTWEISCVPYVPVMDLIVEHCSNLAESDVQGYLMSWSLGAYPSPNLEVPLYFDQKPTPTKEQVLDAMAQQRYKKRAVPQVRKAWTLISEAYREYPYSGAVLYYSPVQIGVANLLRPTKSNYRATMTGFPYDDLPHWKGQYPSVVFAGQFEKMANGFSEAAPLLEEAAKQAKAAYQSSTCDDVRYVKTVQIQFESMANQTRFIKLRDKYYLEGTSAEEKGQIVEQMQKLAAREMELASQLATLMQQDSKIGYESANQYLFVQNDLWEKVLNCQHVIDTLSQLKHE